MLIFMDTLYKKKEGQGYAPPRLPPPQRERGSLSMQPGRMSEERENRILKEHFLLKNPKNFPGKLLKKIKCSRGFLFFRSEIIPNKITRENVLFIIAKHRVIRYGWDSLSHPFKKKLIISTIWVFNRIEIFSIENQGFPGKLYLSLYGAAFRQAGQSRA